MVAKPEPQPPVEPDGQTEERRRKTAAWKFDLLETVAADPLCNGADVEIILAYARYMDAPEGRAYRSNIQLRVATGLSEPTIAERRKNLQALGYMTADGQTSRGVTWYKIRNARENLILDHIEMSGAELRRIDAGRKEADRLKKQAASQKKDGVQETFTPRLPVPQETLGTGYKKLKTTTYMNHVEGFSSEEEELSKVSSVPSTYGQDDDPHLPYPVPESEDELAGMLAELFDGCQLSPVLMAAMRKMLMAGRLTPAIVAEQRRAA